jgi:hypothetical protein
MNPPKLLKALAIAGIGAAAAFAVPMEAKAFIIIDDFNGTDPADSSACTDALVGGKTGICDPTATFIDPINKVMFDEHTNMALGWVRTLDAMLVAGDSVSTEVCYNCDTGHAVSNAASTGMFEWIYTGGPAFDGTQFKYFMIDYLNADVAGGDIALLFDGVEVAGIDDLAVGNTSLMLKVLTADTQVSEVRIKIDGVDRLDVDIDNAKLIKDVPEPGTIIGLLAMGGLGLVSKRKKQK